MTDFFKSVNIGNHFFKVLLCRQPDTKTCLTGTDSRILRCGTDTASIGVYRLCGGDVCVQLTLLNYVDAS